MIRTFCDTCGKECTHRTGHLNLHIEHKTGRGESVGYDEAGSHQLCGECIDHLLAQFALRLRPNPEEGEMRAVEAPARLRYIPDAGEVPG